MDQIPPVLRLDGGWTNPWVLNRAESCLEKHRPAKIFCKNRCTHIIVAFTLVAITRRRSRNILSKKLFAASVPAHFLPKESCKLLHLTEDTPCSPSAISFFFFNIHQIKPKYVLTLLSRWMFCPRRFTVSWENAFKNSVCSFL